MSKKKMEVTFAPGAFKNISDEERAELEEEVRSLFENAEEGELPGELIEEIGAEVMACPVCGSGFELGPELDIPDGPSMQIYDCPGCEKSYLKRPVMN